MDNHHHLLVETPEGNLVRGMRRLNGRYTRTFNRRHGHVGHVFQGRYKSILVEKDAYVRFVAEGLRSPSPWNGLQGQSGWGGEFIVSRADAAAHPHTGVAGIPGEQLRPNRPDCDTVLLNVANYFVCEIEDIISLPQRGIFSCCIPVAKRGEHVPDRDVELIWGFLLQNFPDSANDSGWDVTV